MYVLLSGPTRPRGRKEYFIHLLIIFILPEVRLAHVSLGSCQKFHQEIEEELTILDTVLPDI